MVCRTQGFNQYQRTSWRCDSSFYPIASPGCGLHVAPFKHPAIGYAMVTTPGWHPDPGRTNPHGERKLFRMAGHSPKTTPGAIHIQDMEPAKFEEAGLEPPVRFSIGQAAEYNSLSFSKSPRQTMTNSSLRRAEHRRTHICLQNEPI